MRAGRGGGARVASRAGLVAEHLRRPAEVDAVEKRACAQAHVRCENWSGMSGKRARATVRMCARACGRARAAAAHLLHLRRLIVHAAWWCAAGRAPTATDPRASAQRTSPSEHSGCPASAAGTPESTAGLIGRLADHARPLDICTAAHMGRQPSTFECGLLHKAEASRAVRALAHALIHHEGGIGRP